MPDADLPPKKKPLSKTINFFGIQFACMILMKKIVFILFLISITLSSCRWEYRDDRLDPDYNEGILLADLLQSFDLWYVDIDKTTGTGDIPFVSRAFTMSFMPTGEVYANNNMVGLGYTGNGYGINIGIYRTFERTASLEINDDVYGTAVFEVQQISSNEITLINRANNVQYFLIGYQKYNFDYDKLFYDNIVYFLQEYEAWSKISQDIVATSGVFLAENHLQFFVRGNQNAFASSESIPATPTGQIYWDYTGVYDVFNTHNDNIKKLVLYYDINNTNESFKLTVLDDAHIRLYNLTNGNVFEFEGHQYIQYKQKTRQRHLTGQKHIANYHKKDTL